MKNQFFTFICLLVMTSCKSQVKERDIASELISLQIDKVLLPPAPPPEDGNTIELSQSILDSIQELKLIIMVDLKMNSVVKEGLPSDIPYDFLELIPKGDTQNTEVSIGALKSGKGHVILEADRETLKNSIEFEGIDFLLQFSKMYFNEEYNKVLFIQSTSRSRRAGTGVLHCLEKKEGKWTDVFSKQLEIW